ncbi:MAG: ABC transporter substrate-binding protein [Candidatus Reconcilbacillus cellulovorans]|uniref:ABC transporter substrate-binding protein n=1 Tax=Candidatus Reconcilbacillus cellulovorans TaxID=1906605 RepID=A0A2A6E1C9_9BACL|nr:MAG: ABC transporter substrate-binding protein [Candidatus Reconcilbacillus cellulovorans]
MRHRWLAFAAAVSIALLPACGGGSDKTSGGTASGGQTAASPSPSPQPVELRIMWWGDQTRADITNQALRKFEEKYPHIKVVGEFAPSSSYFDKLNTLLASGTAPDVFFLGGNYPDYADKGVLLDLGPYVGKQLDLSDMDKSLIEYGTYKGKLYHISAGANSRGILVNASMFEKAGIPLPNENWTWDDFANISIELSKKLGQGYYGTYQFGVEGMKGVFLATRGKVFYDTENSKVGFDQKDVEDWFTFWERLYKEGGAVTPELQVANPPDDPNKSLVSAGKVAMNLIPSNLFAAHQKLTQDKLALVLPPQGPNGHGVILESSQGLSGYAKTKHPEEVALLMNFWINDPDATKILGTNRGVPGTSKMRDLLKQNASPEDKLVYEYLDRVSETSKNLPVKLSFNPPGYTEWNKLLETSLQEIAFGRKDAKKAAADFYNGIMQIVAKQQQAAQSSK